MIIISGSIPIHVSKRDEAIAAANTMRDATLLEDGCVEYRFSFATDDPGTVLIFEEWRDADALASHFTQPHMAHFQTALGDLVAGPPNVSKYEATSKSPLR